jgi:flagellin
LLKGNGKTSTVNISAKDAGIDGTLKGVGTGNATFTMTALKNGQSISIGAKGYTIGTSIGTVTAEVAGLGADEKVTIDGTEYTVVAADADEDDTEFKLHADTLSKMVQDGNKVIVGTQTYVAMKDGTDDGSGNVTGANGIGDNDASVISASKAYKLIQEELIKASSIGADAGADAEVNMTTTLSNDGIYSKDNNMTQVSFHIKEGTAEVTQGLQMGLHVGADADGTNKITFTIDTMDSAGLGISGLNLVDNSGAKATYAIDSIADAISKVSAQRSALGAVQNRLEHTINNLDNVSENTTSAESQIRDTDMAETMVEYSKNNILAQAGQSMLAQANQSNQGVLSLLG